MTEVDILSIGAGGSGIGRLADGMVVFVPRTAPGDRVTIGPVERRRRWAQSQPLAVVRPGPARVDPQCPHYVRDRCGGCQIQHLSKDAQLQVKARVVGDALRRLGHLDITDPPITPSPEQWGYRGKVTLHRGSHGGFGFRPYDAPDEAFELDRCLIADRRLMELWAVVRGVLHLLPGDADRLTLALGRDGYRHLAVWSETAWDAEPLVAALGTEDVVVWRAETRKRVIRVAGPPAVIPPTSFEQANEGLARDIREFAVTAVAGEGGGLAWDLFGGFGDTAVQLSLRGYRVWTVDSDRRAKTWGHSRGLASANLRWITGRAEEVVSGLPVPDVVVVNPPRVGMAPALSSFLNDWGKRPEVHMAYVSCDPATLARDLARMPHLRLVDIRAFDLFPQTSHVETVAILAGGGL